MSSVERPAEVIGWQKRLGGRSKKRKETSASVSEERSNGYQRTAEVVQGGSEKR